MVSGVQTVLKHSIITNINKYKTMFKLSRMKPFIIQAVISRIFNNGWRRYDSIKECEKEQSFNSLPETNRYYDIVVKGEIEYRYYYGGCISSDGWVDRNVTHFRLSKRYKLPRW